MGSITTDINLKIVPKNLTSTNTSIPILSKVSTNVTLEDSNMNINGVIAEIAKPFLPSEND
jgi:hypothetical protein